MYNNNIDIEWINEKMINKNAKLDIRGYKIQMNASLETKTKIYQIKIRKHKWKKQKLPNKYQILSIIIYEKTFLQKSNLTQK